MTSKLKERFDALSDAIIAIVMTILVLRLNYQKVWMDYLILLIQ